MPKRWLSLRSKQQNDVPSHDTTSSNHSNSDFNFAFADSPASGPTALASIKKLPITSNDRPTTSAAIGTRANKKLRIDVEARRPRTSEGHRGSTLFSTHRHATSRSQDDLIGVAFGSPSHPPATFRNLAGQMTPALPDHAFGHQGPFLEKQRRLLPKSWKKIGSLFKNSTAKPADPTVTTTPAWQPQQRATRSDESLPRQHPWQHHKSPAPDHLSREAPPPPSQPGGGSELLKRRASKRTSSSEGKTMLLDPTPLTSPVTVETRKFVERPTRLSSLPKLEIDIPNAALDRYTIMFKNAPTAPRSSSLLARRSKTLESLKSSDTSRNNSQSGSEGKLDSSKVTDDAEVETLPARRMTDPKPPKPEFAKAAASSPTVSKYSLFPPPSPVPVKITGRLHQDSPLKRTVSSPARLSPAQPTFPKQQPIADAHNRKPFKEQGVISPDATTASTDTASHAPWSAIHSLKSSVSSTSSHNEEIFFDIKSFRDSKGVEDGQHFVMSRPDSAVVQLARSRSKLTAASRARKQGVPLPPVMVKPTMSAAKADKHMSVNSAVFDEAIAAVEEFTTSQMRPMTDATKSTTSSPAKKYPVRQSSLAKRDLELKLLPPDPVLPNRPLSRGRDQAVKITVPSPIVEEISPSSQKTIIPEKTIIHETPVADLAKSREPQPLAKPTQPITTTPTPLEAPKPNSQPPQSSTRHDYIARKPVPVSYTPATTPAPATKPHIEPTIRCPITQALKRIDHPIEESPTIPQGPPRRPYSPSTVVALQTHPHHASDSMQSASTTSTSIPTTKKTLAKASDSSDRPPPVPAKDSKFIPISKFAAPRTISKFEQAGIRPARLGRSATDNVVMERHTTSQQIRVTGLRKGKEGRSNTIPAPGSGGQQRQQGHDQGQQKQLQQDQQSPQIRAAQIIARERTTPTPSPLSSHPSTQSQTHPQPQAQLQTHTVTTIIQAPPAAELSVARTVSLSRKQSARVMVPGPKLLARRREAAQNNNGIDSGTESTATSVANTPVLVTVSSPKEPDVSEEEEDEGDDRAKEAEEAAKSRDNEHERKVSARSTSDINRSLMNPLSSHPNPSAMDSQISLVSQHSIGAQSHNSNFSTMSQAQEKVDKELIEKYRSKDKSKWDVTEGKRMSPVVVVEGFKGHKPGASVGIVLDVI